MKSLDGVGPMWVLAPLPPARVSGWPLGAVAAGERSGFVLCLLVHLAAQAPCAAPGRPELGTGVQDPRGRRGPSGTGTGP